MHGCRGQACIRGARVEEEAPRLQPGVLYRFSRPYTVSFTAARFPKPATLLGSVILQTPPAHILASCLRGVPLSLPKPREVFNIQSKMHRRSTRVVRGLNNFVGLLLVLGPHFTTCID